MSVCAAPTCSYQSFDGSSYYVDVDVDELKFEYFENAPSSSGLLCHHWAPV